MKYWDKIGEMIICFGPPVNSIQVFGPHTTIQIFIKITVEVTTERRMLMILCPVPCCATAWDIILQCYAVKMHILLVLCYYLESTEWSKKSGTPVLILR